MDFTNLTKLLVDYKWERNGGFCEQKSKNWRNGEYSMNVGYTIRTFEKGRPIMPSRNMIKNDSIYQECKKLFPDYPFQGVQINRNVLCPPHKDTYNRGNSVIFSLGDFSGGRLYVDGEPYDIFENPFEFNGAEQEHFTEPFVGDRYSVVLFNLKSMNKNIDYYSN